jgi:V/A-type H+-transporting ATPase subunit I
MRINVTKFLFMGAHKTKGEFFEAAQKAGIIEFIHPEGKAKGLYSHEVDTIITAIKILRGYVQEEQTQKMDLALADAYATCIVELKNSKEQLEEEKRELDQEIARVAPFGDFSLEDIKDIEENIHRKIRFFCTKTSKHLDEIDPRLILIRRFEGIDHFITIQDEPVVHADLFEMHFDRSLGELQKHLSEVTTKIEQIDLELKGYTRLSSFLHRALLHKINEENLLRAEGCTLIELDNQLFFAEGWVPENDSDKVKDLSSAYSVYFEEVALDPHDVPPTCLQNSGISKVGEDLVRIFDVPSTQDKDPSLWVLFGFALFFSMIVYDAGYGIIFLAVALYLHFRKTKQTSFAKRFTLLMATLAICTTLWGGLTHSYFGIELSRNNFLRRHSLMTWLIEKKAAFHIKKQDATFQEYLKKYPQLGPNPTTEQLLYAHNLGETSETPVADKFRDNVLMELALFVGSLHLCLGLIRYLRSNPVGAGWIAFIVGAYLYLPYYLSVTSLTEFAFGIPQHKAAEFGLQLLFFGLALGPLIGMVLHGFVGIFECMHSIQVFADVLSYLRIYALGTAGFIVSETVNNLASKVPLLVAIGLLLFGHFLNILLAIMGGTIHGLRLNFLEWYRYSFYGGGKDFQPLRLQTLE